MKRNNISKQLATQGEEQINSGDGRADLQNTTRKTIAILITKNNKVTEDTEQSDIPIVKLIGKYQKALALIDEVIQYLVKNIKSPKTHPDTAEYIYIQLDNIKKIRSIVNQALGNIQKQSKTVKINNFSAFDERIKDAKREVIYQKNIIEKKCIDRAYTSKGKVMVQQDLSDLIKNKEKLSIKENVIYIPKIKDLKIILRCLVSSNLYLHVKKDQESVERLSKAGTTLDEMKISVETLFPELSKEITQLSNEKLIEITENMDTWNKNPETINENLKQKKQEIYQTIRKLFYE